MAVGTARTHASARQGIIGKFGDNLTNIFENAEIIVLGF